MNKKILFLLLALIVPVLVFSFLKFFGKNEFVVEPLYQTSDAKLPPECSEVKIPYFITDSAYSYLKEGYEKDSLLLILYEGRSKDVGVSETQLARLLESFQPETEIGLKRISTPDKRIECGLLLQQPIDLVLIDARKRIRGQYNSNDRDEIDRLMTELDIILKRY